MTLVHGIGLALALGAGGVLIAPPVAAADLVPHRAGYVMSLKAANQGSGVVAVKGAMSYAFADSCDGWTVENRTVMTLTQAEGGEIETVWNFVTWESRDGLRYRFRVNSTRDGEVIEEIQGTARLDGKGKGGKVQLVKPEKATLDLPKGTLFPTEHTAVLIDRARAGEKMVSRTVYDGASLDSPHLVTALVGAAFKAGENGLGPLADHALLKRASWRSQMAFFPSGSKESVPTYEVALRLFDNGIAQDVEQDFGGFSVRAKLDKIERLPKPDC